jgi:hypothetical protein
MNNKKSKSHQAAPKSPQDGLNVSELSRLTGADRAAIRKLCATIQPIRVEGQQKFYRLEDIQSALSQKPSKSLKDEKLFEEIRKFRIANDKAEGKLVLKSEVASAIRRVMGKFSEILEDGLVRQLPTAAAGQTVEAIRIYGRQLHDRSMIGITALKKEFPE